MIRIRSTIPSRTFVNKITDRVEQQLTAQARYQVQALLRNEARLPRKTGALVDSLRIDPQLSRLQGHVYITGLAYGLYAHVKGNKRVTVLSLLRKWFDGLTGTLGRTYFGGTR